LQQTSIYPIENSPYNVGEFNFVNCFGFYLSGPAIFAGPTNYMLERYV